MKKITRDVKVYYDFNWQNVIPINSIKNDITEMEKLGATHINVEYWGNDCINFEAFERRLETDLEYNDRLRQRAEVEQMKKENDLKLLAELKAKYEPKKPKSKKAKNEKRS